MGIGVEILVLYSVSFISNIGLLTVEALTGEPNEKYPTFKIDVFGPQILESPDQMQVEGQGGIQSQDRYLIFVLLF